MKDALPKQILNRKKQGFGVPLGAWFKKELKGLTEELLLGREASLREYFQQDYVRGLLDRHQSGFSDNSHRIWTLLCFELWHKKYVDGVNLKELL